MDKVRVEGEPNEGLFYEVDEVVRYRVSFAFVDLDLGNTLENKKESRKAQSSLSVRRTDRDAISNFPPHTKGLPTTSKSFDA